MKSWFPRRTQQQQSSTMDFQRRESKDTSGGETMHSPTTPHPQSIASGDVDMDTDIDMESSKGIDVEVNKNFDMEASKDVDMEVEVGKDITDVEVNKDVDISVEKDVINDFIDEPVPVTPVQPLSLIPQELSPEEKSIYETLLCVVEARRKSGLEAPRVAVITDLAKDYDDLAALIVLKELHRLSVITLVGFVANLMPSERRALFGRGALDSLQLPDIDIARGTTGYTKISYQGDDIKGKAGKAQHKVLEYEFKNWTSSGMPEFPAQNPANEMLHRDGEGEKLLLRLFSEAGRSGKRITLLLISSLEDIYTFSVNKPDILRDGVKNIVLQGGYLMNKENKLVPATDANNNRYDMEAAEKFHTFMQENNIPSAVYTKIAAFATPLYSSLFAELEATGHPLGKHLRWVQVHQDLAFYISACQQDPKKRFADYMDQKWYLKNKTSWFDNLDPNSPAYLEPNDPLYHDENAPYPKGAKVIPYLNKVVVYDALAALGSCGDDAIEALGVLANNDNQPVHRIIGNAGPPVDIGVNPKQMGLALSALLKGSMWASKHGMMR